MTLLRKWWAPVRARLIDDARLCWRFWSMRLAAFGAIATALVQWFPDALTAAWNAMPADMRAYLPAPLIHAVPVILFVAIMVARVVAQSKAASDG
ncbi:MAG TPA: hypothetical protein VN137_05535 [Sphingomonas sp.]|nr:hypothetical protein [Sphingomonas sp.]